MTETPCFDCGIRERRSRFPRILGWSRGVLSLNVRDMPAHNPEEIHALLAAAVNTGDLDAFADLHEQDATVIVPPDGRRVSGRDAIRAAVQPIFALAPRADIEVVGKLEADDLALTHARVSVVATDGAESLEISGRGTVVSRRQPDGTWRIVLDNAMTPD